MISVPNHQQLLSGNRPLGLILFVFLTVITIGCTAKKSLIKKEDTQIIRGSSDAPNNAPVPTEDDAPGSKTSPTTTTKPSTTVPKTKVDTMIFTEKSGTPPITNPPKADEKTSIGSQSKTNHIKGTKDQYRIAMFLPLQAGRNIDESSDDTYIQYYCGAMMAADDLTTQGANILIDVYDTYSQKTVPPGETYDAVVASNDKDQVTQLIAYGKANNTLIISPWYSNSKTTESNPNYLQVNPNLREHFSKMVDHISKHFKPSDVVLVGRNTANDKSWFTYFQEVGKAQFSGKEKPFTEFFPSKDSLELGTNVFGGLMSDGKKVFIIPNYSFKDETHVYQVMRRLAVEKNYHNVYVYGMPMVMESDKIDYDFFKNLNVRIPVAEFVDEDNWETKHFKNRYFEEFGDLPGNDAFEGYDFMSFLGEALFTYGTNFPESISGKTYDYLQTSYNIKRVMQEGKIAKSPTDFDFYENKHLSIAEFVNGKFTVRK